MGEVLQTQDKQPGCAPKSRTRDGQLVHPPVAEAKDILIY